MANPFATGLGALHRGPASVAAVFTPAGGEPFADPIRVIRTTATVDLQVGDQIVLAGSTVLQIMRADVAAPARFDRLTIGGEVFEIIAEPHLDIEGVSWWCEAAPVR